MPFDVLIDDTNVTYPLLLAYTINYDPGCIFYYARAIKNIYMSQCNSFYLNSRVQLARNGVRFPI